MDIRTIRKHRRIGNIIGFIQGNWFDYTSDVNNTFFHEQIVPIYFKKHKKGLNQYLLLLHYNHKKTIRDQFFEFSVCEYVDPCDIGRKRAKKYECLIQNINLEKENHLSILKEYGLE